MYTKGHRQKRLESQRNACLSNCPMVQRSRLPVLLLFVTGVPGWTRDIGHLGRTELKGAGTMLVTLQLLGVYLVSVQSKTPAALPPGGRGEGWRRMRSLRFFASRDVSGFYI